jgi:hypothetical protein
VDQCAPHGAYTYVLINIFTEMTLVDNTLVELNNCADLDIQQSLVNLFGNDTHNPYFMLNNVAKFYDPASFLDRFSNDNKPLFCNLNIQSLHSKHGEFSVFMNELAVKNVFPEIFCLQEIWQVQDENTISLHDYNFV